MEQLADRLESLNRELWRQTSETRSHIEQHVDDVVGLQLMLKHRDEQLKLLRTLDEEHARRTVDTEQQHTRSSASTEEVLSVIVALPAQHLGPSGL